MKKEEPETTLKLTEEVKQKQKTNLYQPKKKKIIYLIEFQNFKIILDL